jgi:hypothetical protein
MTETNTSPESSISAAGVKQARGTGPMLFLAILFVVGAFLTWYFTWFGRELSDADISTYLTDVAHPRKVQHALLQIQQRIDRKDSSARHWYPQVETLASNPETEIRLTVAWLMGFDNQADEFHTTLLKLLDDSEPIVRRNAALALVRFGDKAGRKELRSIFEPYQVKVTTAGTVSSVLQAGATVGRSALLARVQDAGKLVEIRSPLPARIELVVVTKGAKVQVGDLLLTLRSDEESVWEALRGLALVGEKEDREAVESYLQQHDSLSERIKNQAGLTIRSIQKREAVR